MSRGQDDVFGEVRSLLTGVPDEQLFIKVCARWPDGNVPDEIVGYVKGVVSRWPQDVPCAVPPDWVKHVEQELDPGERCAGLAMCKTLKLEGIYNNFARRMVLWAKREELTGLQHLELHGRGSQRNMPPVFFRSQSFARVERLVIKGLGGMNKSMRALLESPLCQGLRLFHLEDTRFDLDSQLQLVTAPQWSRLRAFALRRCGLLEEALVALFAREDLTELGSLDLGEQDLTQITFDALTAWASRAGCLRELNLSGCVISDEIVEVLATHQVFSMLTHLDVSRCELSPHALRMIARSRTLYGLQSLTLNANFVDEETMHVFAHSPTLVGLKTLGLANCSLDARCVELLAESMYASQLERLVISHNHVGDEAMVSVAVSEALEGLRELHVRGCGLGDEGVVALTQAVFFDQLEEIELHNNRFGERGRYALWAKGRAMTNHAIWLEGIDLTGAALKPIIDSPTLDDVRRLDFSNVRCDDAFWSTLAQSPRFRRLRAVSIEYISDGDVAMQALMGWPSMRRVESLSLHHVGLSEAGIRALCGSSYLGNLRALTFRNEELEPEGVEVLLAWEGLAQLHTLICEGCELEVEQLERLLNPVLTPQLLKLRCEVSHLAGRIHHLKELAVARGIDIDILKSRRLMMDILPLEFTRGRLVQSPEDEEIF